MQTAAEIKQAQVDLKSKYQQDPGAAVSTLTARAVVDTEHLSCQLVQPSSLNPAGMHLLGGGDGTWVCPVEIMLAGLASCAGVTLAAVADSMKIQLRSAAVNVSGEIDFCGTLAVSRQATVGLTKIIVRFELDSDAPEASIKKLVELAERYCVVYRTLQTPPEFITEIINKVT